MINKGAVETCFGEFKRDSIDDLCQIMAMWQEVIMKKYKIKYGVEHNVFKRLFYDALNDRTGVVENNLLEISKDFGDVTLEEMDLMVIYRISRNKVAHKSLWRPDGTSQTRKYNKALECMDSATSTNGYIYIRKRGLLCSGFEKIINYLYNY
jgi:hypothetical protein